MQAGEMTANGVRRGEEEEGEERPVSIASLRSKFEGMAAASAPKPQAVRKPVQSAAVAPTLMSKVVEPAAGLAGISRDQEQMPTRIEISVASHPIPETSTDTTGNDARSTDPTNVPLIKARLKPPAPAPKPPALASRPSSPALPQSDARDGKGSRAPSSASSTAPSKEEVAERPAPPPAASTPPSGTTPAPLLSARIPLTNLTAADTSEDGERPTSVQAMLSRFGGGGVVGEAGGAGRINAVAGPSIVKRKPAPPRPDASAPETPSAAPERDAEKAPMLRRTSAGGESSNAIPVSSPPAAPGGIEDLQRSASPRPISPNLPTSRSRSPAPLPSALTTPSIGRAPSPKPPEPDRALKPSRPQVLSETSQAAPSNPPPFRSEVSAAPGLPVRKTSAPTPSPGGPPPIPPNRPKLASVASAVMAAQAFASAPPLPSRYRAETVGTRDTPPLPNRLAGLPPPTKSASVIPALGPRKDRGTSISAVPSPSGRGEVLASPTEDYRPPPPPTRTILPGATLPTPPRRQDTRAEVPLEAESEDDEDVDGPNQIPGLTSAAKRALEDSPDSTHANRRPPRFTPDIKITGTAHTSCFAMHGRYVCTGSHVVRVYDTQLSDQPIHYIDLHQTGLEFRIKDPKVTAMCFRPAAFASEEGRYLWCGTKDGHLWELDIKTGDVTDTRACAHGSPVVGLFRYKQTIMSLEEGGKLHVFDVGQREDGTEEIARIPQLSRTLRVVEKFNFAKLVAGKLWTSSGPANRSTTSAAAAKGPTIRIYDPTTPGAATSGKTVWATEWTGAVTCATIFPLRPDKVYLGHEGGYVSIWDAEEAVCRQVLKISSSDILSLEGVGERLWAGNRKGQIHAYDVSVKPWQATNLWTAHPEHAVYQLAIDPWSIQETGRFVLWSLGKDSLRAWDGLLTVDWIDSQMTARQADYSDFREIKTLVCSWNIDSAKPTDLAGSEANVNFLPDLLHSVHSPEIIVFGFQEVIPLTDKKLTAKTLLFGVGSKNKESSATADKVSHAYRQWSDKLSAAVRFAYPETTYLKVHSESLVGLYTCVFVKSSERDYLRDVHVCTVKRGIGGIYGNKGAIIARLVIDDTSICFINVHLAAGQSAKASRNVDLGVIMEDKAILPVTDGLPFINGGDGTAVLDHELVILNGDLNYRIDQRRENVLSSIQAAELSYLLEHDQLRKEMQSNHSFRLRSFEEAPIHFKPTYKYNAGSLEYDSSEKKRIPAWCDRILYNKTPRLQSLHYRRYEPTVSDHRPISAGFRMQVKAVDQGRMEDVRRDVRVEWGRREAGILEKLERAYLDLV